MNYIYIYIYICVYICHVMPHTNKCTHINKAYNVIHIDNEMT